MTATNGRTGTSRTPRLAAPGGARVRGARRHEDALIAAEVRRLARALAPYRAQPISPSARAQSTVFRIVSRGSV